MNGQHSTPSLHTKKDSTPVFNMIKSEPTPATDSPRTSIVKKEPKLDTTPVTVKQEPTPPKRKNAIVDDDDDDDLPLVF